MKSKNKHSIGLDGSRIITIASVAMVLLVAGIAMLIGFGTDRAAGLIRSNMGFVVVIDPARGGQQSVDSVVQTLRQAPYTSKVTTRTADEVLARWEEMMGPEDLLDVNPFLPEFEVLVKGFWSHPDSLKAIAGNLSRFGCVDHVQTQMEVATQVNRSISSAILILSFIGLALLIISIVLIANTVRLQLHSQRFIIHTQQYVGATPSYIIRPYVMRSAVNGLISGVAASLLLAAFASYFTAIDIFAAVLITWQAVAVTSLVLILFGTFLCAFTARLTARKYVDSAYDEIFN